MSIASRSLPWCIGETAALDTALIELASDFRHDLPMPETFPWYQQTLDYLTFPPSLIFGLLAGLIFRRLLVAALVAGVLSPLANVVLETATSDAPPRFYVKDELMFSASAMLAAAVVWTVARAVRNRRLTGR
jgi:hypothetical protein